jgi:hypothetical protein
LCVLDEQVGYAGLERGRKRERDRKEAEREKDMEREIRSE